LEHELARRHRCYATAFFLGSMVFAAHLRTVAYETERRKGGGEGEIEKEARGYGSMGAGRY
jgi:hypothetical protein